jgi:Spy/CpxP family protein refolding chaperone
MTAETGSTARMKRRIWAGIALVFVCGLAVGTVAMTAYHDYQGQKKWERGLAGMKPRVMQHLQRELDLSAEQRRAVETLVTQAEVELLHLRMAQQPRVQETMLRTIDALKPQLTPEQRIKLDELYRNLERRWASDRDYIRGLNGGSTNYGQFFHVLDEAKISAVWYYRRNPELSPRSESPVVPSNTGSPPRRP